VWKGKAVSQQDLSTSTSQTSQVQAKPTLQQALMMPQSSVRGSLLAELIRINEACQIAALKSQQGYYEPLRQVQQPVQVQPTTVAFFTPDEPSEVVETVVAFANSTSSGSIDEEHDAQPIMVEAQQGAPKLSKFALEVATMMRKIEGMGSMVFDTPSWADEVNDLFIETVVLPPGPMPRPEGCICPIANILASSGKRRIKHVPHCPTSRNHAADTRTFIQTNQHLAKAVAGSLQQGETPLAVTYRSICKMVVGLIKSPISPHAYAAIMQRKAQDLKPAHRDTMGAQSVGEFYRTTTLTKDLEVVHTRPRALKVWKKGAYVSSGQRERNRQREAARANQSYKHFAGMIGTAQMRHQMRTGRGDINNTDSEIAWMDHDQAAQDSFNMRKNMHANAKKRRGK
jgi:hypothetical protein